MQINYDMLEDICDQLPQWILRAKQDVVRSIRDNGIVSFMGMPPDFEGRDFRIMGRLLVAKLVVKAAMDECLFDNFIWISFRDESDWSVKNVQAAIIKGCELGVVESSNDEEDDKNWNEKEVSRRVNKHLANKRFLLVFEDPPWKGINFRAVGVPAFYSWSPSKLLIVNRSVQVSELMQTDALVWLPVEDWSQVYDLIKFECLAIAWLPRFRDRLTQETILSCFKCLGLGGFWYSHTNPVLYWVGEGLLEQRSSPNEHSNNFTEKSDTGKELLSEFNCRGLLHYHSQNGSLSSDNNASYSVYCGCHFHDDSIVCMRNEGMVKDKMTPMYEKLKWISYYWEVRISHECPSASMLVIVALRSGILRDDIFNYLSGLRVLDISYSAISSLPTSVTRLSKSLKVLLLRGCWEMQEIPSAIQSLECLEILDISKCPLMKLAFSSFSFEHLNKIQHLNLSKIDNLSSLPQSIYNFCNLEEFDLSRNKNLIQLPDTLLQLTTKLVFLDLSKAVQLHSLPSSISACSNLKTLLLKECSSLQIGVSHIYQLQTLETLDLSGCCSLQDVSTFNPIMPKLQKLNLSSVTGIVRLSLRSCPSLEEVELNSCSRLEELDLSGTKIKRFPHEAFSRGSSLKRFYMLGNLNLLKVNWESMEHLPNEIFYVDECCEMGNSSHPSAVEKLHQIQDEAFISIRNTSTFFNGYRDCYAHLLCNFLRVNIIISPCEEKEIKGKYFHFQREHFRYKVLYDNFSSPSSSTPAIKLSPNMHFAHSNDRSHMRGRLEIKGASKFKGSLDGVFPHIQFFSMFNTNSVIKLSEFGLGNMRSMRECWLERCHGMETVFVEDSKSREPEPDTMSSLEILWISNLSRLTTVCTFGDYGGRRFAVLKHLNLEYCPQLVSVFTFSSVWGASFECLETLEIKFCVRLEDIYVEEGPFVRNQVTRFPRLQTLSLWELSSLKTIARPQVSFPNLKKLNVRGCPNLNKLPISFDNLAKKEGAKIEIKGEWAWWKNIKWPVNNKNFNEYVNFTGWKPPNKKISVGACMRKAGR